MEAADQPFVTADNAEPSADPVKPDPDGRIIKREREESCDPASSITNGKKLKLEGVNGNLGENERSQKVEVGNCAMKQDVVLDSATELRACCSCQARCERLEKELKAWKARASQLQTIARHLATSVKAKKDSTPKSSHSVEVQCKFKEENEASTSALVAELKEPSRIPLPPRTGPIVEATEPRNAIRMPAPTETSIRPRAPGNPAGLGTPTFKLERLPPPLSGPLPRLQTPLISRFSTPETPLSPVLRPPSVPASIADRTAQWVNSIPENPSDKLVETVDLTEEDEEDKSSWTPPTPPAKPTASPVRHPLPLPPRRINGINVQLPRPTLSAGKIQQTGKVTLQWTLPKEDCGIVRQYELFAYQESRIGASWSRVQILDAVPTPMACVVSMRCKPISTVETYHFAVRAVSGSVTGDFSPSVTVRI